MQASPAVHALLDSKASPPPAPWVRATLYHYDFAAPALRGQWWQRRRVGEYLPALRAGDSSLRAFLQHHGLLPATTAQAEAVRAMQQPAVWPVAQAVERVVASVRHGLPDSPALVVWAGLCTAGVLAAVRPAAARKRQSGA